MSMWEDLDKRIKHLESKELNTEQIFSEAISYDVVVYKDDSGIVHAFDKDGEIDANSDAGIVINSIFSTHDQGAKISLGRGTFNIGTDVVFPSNKHRYIFEGRANTSPQSHIPLVGTRLDLDNGVVIEDEGTKYAHVKFKNLWIVMDGSWSSPVLNLVYTLVDLKNVKFKIDGSNSATYWMYMCTMGGPPGYHAIWDGIQIVDKRSSGAVILQTGLQNLAIRNLQLYIDTRTSGLHFLEFKKKVIINSVSTFRTSNFINNITLDTQYIVSRDLICHYNLGLVRENDVSTALIKSGYNNIGRVYLSDAYANSIPSTLGYGPDGEMYVIMGNTLKTPQTIDMGGSDGIISPRYHYVPAIPVYVDAGGSAVNLQGIDDIAQMGITCTIIHTGGENIILVDDAAVSNPLKNQSNANITLDANDEMVSYYYDGSVWREKWHNQQA